MKPDDLLKRKREEILRAVERYGARNVRVFGSVARNEADEKSDIDLLIDPGPEMSLFTHAELEMELEELLGRKVHLISARGLRPRVRENVMRDAVPL
ncbi:MAG: nucleotidyltransferase [Candidatus Tectomicrobia bacterium RIFCSPLOWO2_12_FULL_69_37]|nr:MAG: nucleotidyltransferase [Candidatus Tectomicrobia bacterium RIFCSPLOWO2_02_FULL_70_19]OGL64191.1 MAG: nucleotidyltransferase [Candidatus Tectomicrobia bacterium RIFCSPLOWO2_12_FULL_69_37]